TASGMCNTPGLGRLCKESYNQPAEVYARCKELGMTIVTLTDHDSIDAAEELRRHPDFFVSEEVTCRMPSGSEVHIGVYNLNERDHIEVQRRRKDFVSLLMYLTEQRLFFSANHIFSGLTGKRTEDDFHWFASYVPAFEIRNGQMWPKANRNAQALAKRLGKIAIGGSDSHAMRGVGLTYTEVPGAQTVEDFFAGLRAKRGKVRGADGSLSGLTADIFSISKNLFQEKPATLALLPLGVLIPAITAGHWANEILFCRKWAAHFREPGKTPRMLWDLQAGTEQV
ncbi:MAG TPA: PHP domain-containing protein, partial [Candidatus Acidoferrum sp.]